MRKITPNHVTEFTTVLAAAHLTNSTVLNMDAITSTAVTTNYSMNLILLHFLLPQRIF